MSKSAEQLLDDALGALQPFYDPGDDGSPIRLSLDAIGGLLAQHAGVLAEDLAEALRALGADSGLVATITQLHEVAKGGEYGAGLRENEIDEVNGAIEEVHDPLRELVLQYLHAGRSPRPDRVDRHHPKKKKKNTMKKAKKTTKTTKKKRTTRSSR